MPTRAPLTSARCVVPPAPNLLALLLPSCLLPPPLPSFNATLLAARASALVLGVGGDRAAPCCNPTECTRTNHLLLSSSQARNGLYVRMALLKLCLQGRNLGH